MKKIKIKIGDLFNKLDIKQIDIVKQINGIYVKTPAGNLTEVKGFIKKSPKKIFKYDFTNNISIKCSDEHLFLNDGKATHAKKCNKIDTINGQVDKVSEEYVCTDNVYDICIDDPHLYITPNGVIHHNTSLVTAIIKELDADVKWLNGSQDRGIDTFKVSVKEFITSVSIDDSPKIVVIDECLEENEEIMISDSETMKLKDMVIGETYECMSFNKETSLIEKDTCEVISFKDDEVYEIETEDGRTVKLTGDHPILVKDNIGNVTKKSINEGLSEEDYIIDWFIEEQSNKDSLGVPVTVNMRKDQVDILKNSNINLEHLLRGFLDTIIEEQK